MRNFLIVIIFLFLSASTGITQSWPEIVANGSGIVTVYYYPIKPFIYKDADGNLKGIEKEILESFFRYAEKKHKVEIFQEWKEVKAFENLIGAVAESETSAFGVSIISRTAERAKRVSFSNAYMPDVSVLITHISVPQVKDSLMLINHLKGLKGATISNTTYQYDLQKLSDYYGLELHFVDAANDENIIQLVSKNKDILGYVGLPFYVMKLNDGSQVKRQELFEVKRDGYRFIHQKNSGWNEPVRDYFNSYLYKAEADKIIRKYLGNDYSELIWGLARNQDARNQNDQINFLTREKEMQSRTLLASQKEQELQRLIIISISIGLFFIFLIVMLLFNTNRIKARDNALLMQKGRETEELLNRLSAQKDEILHQRQLLQEKNNELTEINKQKDELIGLVAHDLKSPINQMSGLINLLGYKNDTWDADEIQVYKKLESSNQHLKELVERILDLEAMGRKSLKYNMLKIDMASVMNDTLEDFEEKASLKQISIDVSGLNQNLIVVADPFFLRQVFENLLSNAIKFSPPNTTVSISSDEVDEFYQISIRDEGPGIAKDEEQKLFTKYQTLSAKPTGDESSTGLGLSIVKKYVEEMHGSVWYDNGQAKGANFIVAFPKA